MTSESILIQFLPSLAAAIILVGGPAIALAQTPSPIAQSPIAQSPVAQSPAESTHPSSKTTSANSGDIAMVANSQSDPEDPAVLSVAVATLQTSRSQSLCDVLAAMDSSEPTATNRLMAIASNLLRQESPAASWRQSYVLDRSHPAAARTLIFRTLQSDQKLNFDQDRWIDQFLATATDDPAPVLRRLAIDVAIDRAETLMQSDSDSSSAASLCREILALARHPKQSTKIATMLRQLGDPVTTAQAMSTIMRWHVIGPFDNVEGVGFDNQYPPQMQYVEQSKVDLGKTYQGKNDTVRWSEVTASDEGMVDLHEFFNQEKGATAYAYVSLHSDQAGPAQLRLQSITANKVWVNGERKMVNAVSHSGSAVDQYVADFDLKVGENTILIKTCQNEQTQPWAQKWEYQCRITDPTGRGIELQ